MSERRHPPKLSETRAKPKTLRASANDSNTTVYPTTMRVGRQTTAESKIGRLPTRIGLPTRVGMNRSSAG